MSIFNGIASIDFNIVLSILLGSLVIFWFFVTAWTFLDARDRTHSRGIILLYSFLVLVFNVPGLLIYLIVRPKSTLEEQYWADLEKRYLLYETAELYDCPKCAFPLQPNFLNCPNCSEVIKTKCNECGANIDRYWKYCSKCGAKSTYVRDTIVTSQSIEQEEASKLAPETITKKDERNFITSISHRFNNIQAGISSKMEKIRENNMKKKELEKELREKKRLEQEAMKLNTDKKKIKKNKKKNKKK